MELFFSQIPVSLPWLIQVMPFFILFLFFIFKILKIKKFVFCFNKLGKNIYIYIYINLVVHCFTGHDCCQFNTYLSNKTNVKCTCLYKEFVQRVNHSLPWDSHGSTLRSSLNKRSRSCICEKTSIVSICLEFSGSHGFILINGYLDFHTQTV